ncbi:MAG: DotA/TraY family protein [Gammaproteobacteria bacterium]|nr:DotA/TraY family protein [Gammaproteobacteria bacterium]MBU1558371.1 DotA/TraY family protein [Gammaproteobacteria bacterium]MBU1629417.1 DotA/TraY family protein [Gammaproteobacteria bacterium]
MKKAFKFFLIFVGVMFFAHSAFAIDLPFHDFFVIPPKDLSYDLLGRLFGAVGTPGAAVVGTQAGILNTMFRIFNESMLVLATLIILYTLLISIVRTAHEGEFMGKQFDSLWIPLRSVAGFALIIPTPGGYSIIQIFLMWIIVQGIGAADTLWTATVKQLVVLKQQGSGMIISPASTFSMPAQKLTMNLLKDSLCMHRSCSDDTSCSKSYDNDQLMAQPITDGNNSIGYQFQSWGGDADGCGKVLWPNPEQFDPSDVNYQKYTSIGQSMENIIPTLDYAAKHHVWAGSSPDINEIVYSATTNPVQQTAYLINEPLQKIADDYVNSINSSLDTDMSTRWQEAIEGGWLYAGSLYHNIAELGNSANGIFDLSAVTNNITGKLTTQDEKFANALFTYAYVYTPIPGQENQDNQPIDWSNIVNFTPHYSFSDFINGTQGFDINIEWQKFFIALTGVANHGISLWGSLLNGVPSVTTDPQSGYFADQTVDPILKLQALGNYVVKMVDVIFAVGFAIMLVASIVLTLCWCITPAFMILDLTYKMVVIPIMFVLMILYVSGLTFSVYLPLAPFIIFTFSAIGWLIATIETMIAAPLVALGICYPEGSHFLLGRADPAVMMVANIFLRPSLMLFGLISGMVLTYVAIYLFNSLFAVAIQSVITVTGGISNTTFWNNLQNLSKIPDPVQFVLLFVIYVLSIVAIVNRSFSLIHLIPDRVLSWIGGTSQFGQYAEGMEQQVSQGFQSAAGQAKQMVSGTAQKFGQQVSSAKTESQSKVKTVATGGVGGKEGMVGKITGK